MDQNYSNEKKGFWGHSLFIFIRSAYCLEAPFPQNSVLHIQPTRLFSFLRLRRYIMETKNSSRTRSMLFLSATVGLSALLAACGGIEDATAVNGQTNAPPPIQKPPVPGPSPAPTPSPTPSVTPTPGPTPAPTPTPALTYSVGGSVSGLTPGKSVSLRNGSDQLVVPTSGAFTFSTKLANGSTYSVSVLTPPSGQTCSVSNPSGTVTGANVANVGVTCVVTTTPPPPSSIQLGPQPIAATDLSKGTLFVSPKGSGSTCSKALPCSIWTASTKVKAGDVVFLRGGTYTFDKNLRLTISGTSTAPITYESYPGELAVFDGTSIPKSTNIYIGVSGNFMRIRNLEIKNMPRQGIWVNGNNNLIEGIYSHHNGLSGIQITALENGANGSRNVIRNSTSSHNSGAGISDSIFADGGNSDGIAISSGSDNRIENCLVHNNSDDGVDTWRSVNSYVGYSIAHSNGIASGNGNGIKAGGPSPSANTLVEHNLAYSNKMRGFDYNSGVAVKFINNTSWKNTYSYAAGSSTIVTNNIAAETARQGTGIAKNNSWQLTGTVNFASTDSQSGTFLVPKVGTNFEKIGAHAVTP